MAFSRDRIPFYAAFLCSYFWCFGCFSWSRLTTGRYQECMSHGLPNAARRQEASKTSAQKSTNKIRKASKNKTHQHKQQSCFFEFYHGHFWLARSITFYGGLEAMLGATLGARLGELMAVLKRSWGLKGGYRSFFGRSVGDLGAKLGAIRPTSGRSWGPLGPSLGDLGASWLGARPTFSDHVL